MPASDHPIEWTRRSLFRAGLPARLALAILLSGLVWLAIGWALVA